MTVTRRTSVMEAYAVLFEHFAAESLPQITASEKRVSGIPRQLKRLGFSPRAGLAYETLTKEGRGSYVVACVTLGLPLDRVWASLEDIRQPRSAWDFDASLPSVRVPFGVPRSTLTSARVWWHDEEISVGLTAFTLNGVDYDKGGSVRFTWDARTVSWRYSRLWLYRLDRKDVTESARDAVQSAAAEVVTRVSEQYSDRLRHARVLDALNAAAAHRRAAERHIETMREELARERDRADGKRAYVVMCSKGIHDFRVGTVWALSQTHAVVLITHDAGLMNYATAQMKRAGHTPPFTWRAWRE